MITIIDKDKPIHGGMRSTVDGKVYSSRQQWDEHLKRNGCRQLEAGEGSKPLPLQGRYNCRKELTEATREALRK